MNFGRASFTPDGKRVCFSGRETLLLWDVSGGGGVSRPLLSYRSPDGGYRYSEKLWGVQFGPDKAYALTNQIVIDLSLRDREDPVSVREVPLMADDKSKGLGGNFLSLKPIATLPRLGPLADSNRGAVFDSKLNSDAAWHNNSPILQHWSPYLGAVLWNVELDAPVKWAVFSPRESRVLALTDDGVGYVRKTNSFSHFFVKIRKSKELIRLKSPGKITDAWFISEDRVVTTSDDDTVRVWDVATENPSRSSPGEVRDILDRPRIEGFRNLSAELQHGISPGGQPSGDQPRRVDDGRARRRRVPPLGAWKPWAPGSSPGREPDRLAEAQPGRLSGRHPRPGSIPGHLGLGP